MERVIQLNHFTIPHMSSMDICDQSNRSYCPKLLVIKRHKVQQVLIETFYRLHDCLVYFLIDKLQVQTHYNNKVVRFLMFQVATVICTKVQYLQFVFILWYWTLRITIVYYVFGYVQV